MKEREYLHVVVLRNDGSVYVNELRLNEVHLIKNILRLDHIKRIESIELVKCTYTAFKMIFA